jgi:hypothetical protein
MNKSKYVELEVYKDEKKRKKLFRWISSAKNETIKAFPLSSFNGVLKHTCTMWTVNSYVINGTSMIDHDGSS